MATLQDGIAEKAVQLVPRLWGNEPGVLAGRLCSRAVTIADSPARVKTGALMNLGSDDMPVDGTGEVLELATLQALEAQRFSVPMWYPDYDGFTGQMAARWMLRAAITSRLKPCALRIKLPAVFVCWLSAKSRIAR